MYKIGDMFEPKQDPSKTLKIIGKYDNAEELCRMLVKTKIVVDNVVGFLSQAHYPYYFVKEISVKSDGSFDFLIINSGHKKFEEWTPVTTPES